MSGSECRNAVQLFAAWSGTACHSERWRLLGAKVAKHLVNRNGIVNQRAVLSDQHLARARLALFHINHISECIQKDRYAIDDELSNLNWRDAFLEVELL